MIPNQHNITPLLSNIQKSNFSTPMNLLGNTLDSSTCKNQCGYVLKCATKDCYKTVMPYCGPKLGTTSVTGTQLTTSVTPSLGLGGIIPATSGAAGTTGDAKTEPPKQQKLPNEISITVDSFKEFVKKQKALSSEVMRVSIKPLHTVSREAEARLREALCVRGAARRGRARAKHVRQAAAAALAAAESVARDCTPGSELEGMAPPHYVKELVAELEQNLITFRRQMEVADKQMQSTPKLLTEQELSLGMGRMHQSLVALAGRLQGAHSQVEEQLRQYRNLRTYVLKQPDAALDAIDNRNSSLDQILQDADISRKKLKTLTDSNRSSAVLSDPRAALGDIQKLAGPTPFSYIGNALSPFPSADQPAGPSWQSSIIPATNQSLSFTGPAPATTFQLQKPPGKRGKQ